MKMTDADKLAFISTKPIVRRLVKECLENSWRGDYVIASGVTSKKLNLFEFDYLLLDFDECLMISEDDLFKHLKNAKKSVYIFVDKRKEHELSHIKELFSANLPFVVCVGELVTDVAAKISEIVRKISPACDRNAKLKFVRTEILQAELIVIGASTGGPEAIKSLVRQLPENMPPIFIVLHMPRKLMGAFCKRLQSFTSLNVVDVTSSKKIEDNSIYIASGDKHMVIKNRDGQLYAESGNNIKVNNHCPSVDVLFRSVAECHNFKRLGILMTGMGVDGAMGLLQLKKSGALTVAQDQNSAAVYGMPRAAAELDAADYILSLDDIISMLTALDRYKRPEN